MKSTVVGDGKQSQIKKCTFGCIRLAPDINEEIRIFRPNCDVMQGVHKGKVISHADCRVTRLRLIFVLYFIWSLLEKHRIPREHDNDVSEAKAHHS